MSGGSFEYIHRKSVEDLTSYHQRDYLHQLIGFLRVNEYDGAAEEFEQFTRAIQEGIKEQDYSEIYGGSESSEASIGLELWWSQLKWLAKSAERWHDGDHGEHRFREAWKQYKEDMRSVENSKNKTAEGDNPS